MKRLFLLFMAFMYTGLVMNAQVNLTDGLIAYFPFNGNANDESGNGNFGTVNNANLVSDRFGNSNSAYYFDDNSKITLNKHFLDGAFTFVIWIKVDDISVGGNTIFSNGTIHGYFGNGFYGMIDPSKTYLNYAKNKTSSGFSFANDKPFEFKDGEFHCLIYTWNGLAGDDAAKIFVDGELFGSIRCESNVIDSDRNLTLGFGTDGVTRYQFKGILDDVYIYNRVLNESEIRELYGTSISTIDQTKILGNPVEVPIITSQLNPSDNIISYQCKIVYDQTKLQYSDKTLVGTLAEGGSVVINSSTPGNLQVSYMNSNPLSGAGDILKLHFNTLEAGTSPVTISNFLYNTTPVTSITNGTITINENIPPTAAITISDTDGKVKSGDIITITATFNESMADTPVPQIIMGGAVTLPATNMTKVTDMIYTYTYTVANGNGEVNISMATGTDLTGNIVTATPTVGGVFFVDNINPEVTITYSDPDLKVRAGNEIVIMATFSEPLAEGSEPVITLNGANTLPATALNKISSTQFSFNYTVKNGNGNISVSISNATDEVGNMLVESTNNAIQVIGFRYGDVDDNGIVQAYDAALALQYSVGLDPLKLIDPLPWESWRILAADVDNVEGITANDASLILQYSADLISSFPVENSLKNALVTNDDILVSAEEGFLVFRSLGNLYGLNITLNNSNNCLGSPVLSNQNMISAVNISDSFYAVGVASASSIKNGEVIMKIPFKCSPESGFSLNLIINSTKKQVNVDLTTGIGQQSLNKLLIFPNPAHDVLHYTGPVCYRITILDINGKTVYDEPYTESKINIGNLNTGLYLIKAETDDGIISERFVKR